MTFAYVYMWINYDMLFAKEVANDRRIEAAMILLVLGQLSLRKNSFLIHPSFNFVSLQT